MPITLQCEHNYCKLCLKQLLQANSTQCPMCRLDISEFDLDTASINKPLRKEIRNKYPEIYKSRKDEHAEDMEDQKNKIIKKLIVGNDCKDEGEGWKTWTFYILMEDDENIEDFIEKLEVNLHPTFNPPKLTYRKPPFEIQRTGWGTFEINFTVYFTELTKKRPVDLSWYLSFRDGGRQRTFDLEFDKRHIDGIVDDEMDTDQNVDDNNDYINVDDNNDYINVDENNIIINIDGEIDNEVD